MSEQPHWLYRTENRPKLWGALYLILFLSLVMEFFVRLHPHFEEQVFALDATRGFYAWYGFLTCAAMVVAAKLLGFVLKRGEDYYDE